MRLRCDGPENAVGGWFVDGGGLVSIEKEREVRFRCARRPEGSKARRYRTFVTARVRDAAALNEKDRRPSQSAGAQVIQSDIGTRKRIGRGTNMQWPLGCGFHQAVTVGTSQVCHGDDPPFFP